MTLFLLGNLAVLASIAAGLACFHPRIGYWLGLYTEDDPR